jgi:hypothetical protein
MKVEADMAENGPELRSIAWSQAFPFVRLFKTLRLALGMRRMALALACVLCCYIGGRIFDAIWGTRNGVVALPQGGRLQTEIQVYTQGTHGEFRNWLRDARGAAERTAILALRQNRKAASDEEARRALAGKSLRSLLIDADFEARLRDLRQRVTSLLATGLADIDNDQELPATERAQKRQDLFEAADMVRRMLAGSRHGGEPAGVAGQKAIELLAAVDPASKAKDQAALTDATARQALLREYERLKPRGPFINLLTYEMHCFAAAIQGVCNGRWGFQGRAFDPQPAMCGSIESAVRGLCWLVNQRPWYALFFGIFNLLIFALLGGAICRSAAVQATRDENISFGEALHFVRQRYGGFVLAPLLPIAGLIIVFILMFIGGLIGAIGYIGELFTGVFYPLALLGGLAAAVLVLAVVIGFHLMWPTIAVEGSDGFDALSRACSYVGSRIWHVGFYAFVLLLYGGVSFVVLRVVLVLVLKLAHKFTGAGMNLISSAELSVGKLHAMWSMPAWADLTLLPSTGETNFWGTFYNGPLDSTEKIGAFLLAAWVYLCVGLLCAFVVSYFFCGGTQMYFLLRRSVDATDYDEIYYEEPAEEPLAPVASTVEPPPASTPPTGEPPPPPPPEPPPPEPPPAP